MRLDDVKSNKKSKAHFTTSININNLTSDDMLKLINERQLTFNIAKYQKLYFLSTVLSVFIVYKTSKEKGYLRPLKIILSLLGYTRFYSCQIYTDLDSLIRPVKRLVNYRSSYLTLQLTGWILSL